MQAQSSAFILPSGAAAARRPVRLALFAAATVGLLWAGPAMAQEAGQTEVEKAPAPAKTAKADKNDKVCETQVVTGSRMKKRVCYTPEQWEARERAAKEMTRELDNRPIGERRVDEE